MSLDAFDFDLPDERIARQPADRRDAARLLVLDRCTGATKHATVAALAEELDAGDLLVVNDTRVRPARLQGRKASGGRVELLLVRPEPDGTWVALIDVARPPQVGSTLDLDGGLTAEVLERTDEGWRLRVVAPADGDVEAALERHGQMPLPPYVRRGRDDDAALERLDRERYQTIFADRPGAVAAPTAGLHFTPELVETLERGGVRLTRVTLHVGPGTFLPVRVERIEEHRMHEEWCEVPASTARAVAETRAAGHRVVAVGTTVVRTLESRADERGRVEPGSGRSSLFIRPGYRFRVIDAMVTNFHLPRSTLLMLVAAFADRDRVLAAYRAAIDAGYRFYSYGDAMLIHDTVRPR